MCTTYLFPDTFNQIGPHVHHYFKFFQGREHFIPLGTPCDHFMAIIDLPNAVLPFIVTVFLVLSTVFSNQCHYATNGPDFSTASMN